PSANLTAFVTDTLREHKEVIAVSCDNRRRGGIAQLQRSLAQLFAAGVHLDVAALYAHRSVPPLELTATPAQPARPPITVTLEMPELSLPKDWAPLRRRPTTPSPAPAAPPPQRTPDKPAGVSPADARTALLRSHFALMDEFLASQSRVLTQLSGARASGARAGVAPGAGFPLLGTLGAHDATHLKARCHLDLQQDAFLLDHAIGGRPSVNRPQAHALAVVPFTFSMEIAAEAAVALGGGDTKLVGLDEVRGSRWLALDEDRLTLDVQATALPAAPDGMRRTQVRLYEVSDSTQAASATPAFEAIVLTAKAWPTAPAARDWTSTDERAPQANPDGELYRHGMFHGPRLQGVQRITRWGERSLDAELVTLPATGYFGFTRTPRFQLDAALLDAAGSLVAYWVAEREDWASNCFPFHIAGFRQYCAPQPAGRHLLGRLDARDEAGVVSADLDVIDPTAHSLLMRVEGWQDRKFAVQARFQRFRLDPVNEFLSTPHSTGDGVHLARVEAFPASFLDGGGGIWLRVLAHMVLHEQELAAFHALPSRGSRREEWLMGRIAAKDAVRAWVRAHHQRALADADIVILQDALRRPTAQVPGLAVAPVVSISHSDRWGFGAAAGPAAGLGVDYQRPRPINAEALATGALTPEEHRWINGLSGVALTARLAALWCAKEAAAKAAGTGLEGRPRDWRVIDWNVSGEAAQARVVHRQQAFNVKLMQTADGECVAWCQHYAVQTQPTPTIA
ncbi:MAG TPA: 4'-phosphopantetheinyl transferase superfamily protein, partial [Nevskiaceae bacterium]|nr:4'-phosphopantetheinyl transferase superfamily protein [Nevskiaceae bacterium]